MRPNHVRSKMEAGEKVVNGWCGIPSPVVAELMAHAGFDSVTIDMQHGLVGYSDMVTMLQAISQTDVTPMVRVPWLDPTPIMKALDAGSYGIICPMVNTAEEAEQFVQYCSYAPRGARSFGPVRANVYAGSDYFQHANKTVLKIAMIETVQAFDNREAICATPDLDGIYIGPSDLGLSMGYTPGLDPETAEVVDAMDEIKRTAHDAGLICCVHTGAGAYANRMHKKGFNLVSVGSDARLLMAGAAAWMSDAKAEDVEAGPSGY